MTTAAVVFDYSGQYLANASPSTSKTATEIAGQLAELKTDVTSLESSWQGIEPIRVQWRT
ncbi:hypothetical protein ACIOKD_01080 [Streptomyces sp. NPDC087844]|uniref:hypothetical protein n=1 Tax=Streptomyces sp. NPDC087844 TaxID=3365805 RepID=UPI0037F6396D